MGTDLTFATGRFPGAVRFVLVNNRVPRMGEHCALCGGLIEKGYVRDSQTRFAIRSASQDGRMRRPPSSKIVEEKRHEMFKSNGVEQ